MIEEQVGAALRKRAEGEVDSAALLAGALVRARRRRTLAVASVAGLTAVALAAVPLWLGGGGDGAPAGSVVEPSATAGQYPVPALPAAEGVPDELVVHFGADTLPFPVDGATWAVQGGVESLELSVRGSDGATGFVRAQTSRTGIPDPAPSDPATPSVNTRSITVDGHPATLKTHTYEGGSRVEWTLTWEPAEGLHARVDIGGVPEADVLKVAEALRFNRSYRCGVPLRLTALPDGASPKECRVWMSDGAPREADLVVGTGAGAVKVSMVGYTVPLASMQPQPEATTQPNGWQGGWRDDKHLSLVNGIEVEASGSYGRDEISAVASGLRGAGTLDKPETWPADPLR